MDLRAITENTAGKRFRAAMWAYALSFGLIGVSMDGGGSFPGAYCAYAAFMMPVSPIVDSRFFDRKASMTIPGLISGLIDIAFLASLAMRWWEGNRRPFKILRIVTLLKIPSCWDVFHNENLYPREGHVLWVVAMVVALFFQPSVPRSRMGNNRSTEVRVLLAIMRTLLVVGVPWLIRHPPQPQIAVAYQGPIGT